MSYLLASLNIPNGAQGKGSTLNYSYTYVRSLHYLISINKWLLTWALEASPPEKPPGIWGSFSGTTRRRLSSLIMSRDNRHQAFSLLMWVFPWNNNLSILFTTPRTRKCSAWGHPPQEFIFGSCSWVQVRFSGAGSALVLLKARLRCEAHKAHRASPQMRRGKVIPWVAL